MSADNGYILCQCEDTGKYGLFYYNASVDYPPSHYIEKNAMALWTHPITAIIEGHEVANKECTEYGLHIHASVVNHAKVRWAHVKELIVKGLE